MSPNKALGPPEKRGPWAPFVQTGQGLSALRSATAQSKKIEDFKATDGPAFLSIVRNEYGASLKKPTRTFARYR